MTVGLLVAVAALGVLATWAHLRFWRWKLARPQPYATLVRLATPHGHAELRRIAVPAVADPVPLLLVHGVAVNHRNLDPWGRWSHSRAFAAARA